MFKLFNSLFNLFINRFKVYFVNLLIMFIYTFNPLTNMLSWVINPFYLFNSWLIYNLKLKYNIGMNAQKLVLLWSISLEVILKS
jgi:hypothetical protein